MTSEDASNQNTTDNNEDTSLLRRLEEELVLTGRYKIARLYVTEEVFDAILPILGIILAGYIAAHMQELFIVFETTLLAAVGASIAHLISGMSGTYLVEHAEGKQLIEEMMKSKDAHLSRSIIITAEHETTMLLSILKGAVPAGSVILVISPMFFALFGLIDYIRSFILSAMIGLGILFLLGVFLGKISKTNVWVSGLKTLFAGLLMCSILIVISLLTGA